MFLAIIIVYFFFFTGTYSHTETDDNSAINSKLLRLEKEMQDMQRLLSLTMLGTKLNNVENCNCRRGKESGKRLLTGSSSEPNDSARVAFFANQVTVNHNLKIHEALAFGNIVTNVGNNYHKETGMFVCTIPGYYVFSVNVINGSGSSIRTTLVQNGSVKQQFYSGDPTNPSNGGSTVVLHVSVGDLVWVRLETSDGAHSIGWESNFTGFLLYQD